MGRQGRGKLTGLPAERRRMSDPMTSRSPGWTLPALGSIVQHPDPVLAADAAPVEEFGRALRKLRHRLLTDLANSGGVGLAAPQVGLSVAAFVWDDGRGHRGFVANPRVGTIGEAGWTLESEGCLSVGRGEKFEEVWRWAACHLSGRDERGAPVVHLAEGLLARIFQHEADHLRGRILRDSDGRAP